MFKLVNNILLLVSSLFFVFPAQSVTLPHLYEVSVPVYSQSVEERKDAISKAFEELLIRITGKRDVLNMPSGQRLLSKSRQFVHSFRYEALPPPMVFELERPLSLEIEGNAVEDGPIENIELESDVVEFPVVLPTQKMIVSFDEQAVKNSLWQQALPVWGKTRPTTLIWLATEDDEQRVMLDIRQPSEIGELINEQSVKRGIPLRYPRLDVIDQQLVNVTDVLGSHKMPVENASLRYSVEAVISTSFLYDSIEGWQTRWNLYQPGVEVSWRVVAPDLNIAIFEGMDKLASILADRYAQVPSGNESDRFLMTVQDVSNLSGYDKINRYLAALSVIKRAELVQVQANEVVYELELRSNPKALKQAIALGKTLVNQDDPFADEVEVNRLNYRLMP